MGIHSGYRRQRLCDTQEKNITEVNIISAYGKGLKINGLAICKDQAVHHIDTYHKVKPYGCSGKTIDTDIPDITEKCS
jgi:hypothetical protein